MQSRMTQKLPKKKPGRRKSISASNGEEARRTYKDDMEEKEIASQKGDGRKRKRRKIKESATQIG